MRPPLGLLVVAAVAVLARVAVLVAIHDAPFWKVPIVDESAYIASANLLIEGSGPPHGAHYAAPGYAYLLAGLRSVGASPESVRWLQMAAGVLSAVLLWVLTRRFFGGGAAMIAGITWALYPGALFHEARFLKPSLTVCLVLIALTLIMRRDAQWRGWTAAGLALGVAALLRPEMMFVALLLAAGGWWGARRGWPHVPAMPAPALALAMVAAVVAIPTVENIARGGGAVVVAYGGGTNFYLGNNPDADGSYKPLRKDRSDAAVEENDAVALAEEARGGSLRPAQVSRYWWGRGLSWWQADPGAALALTIKKAVLLWAAQEQHDSLSTHLAGQYVWPLRNPILRPGVVLPLALVGLWLTRRRRELWPIWAVLVATQIVLTPFFLFERFRLPMTAACVPLMAAALWAAVETWRSRRWQVVVLSGLGTAVLAFLLTLPQVSRNETVLRVNLGGMLLRAGQVEAALTEFRAVKAAEPSAWRVNINIATALAQKGDVEGALRALYESLQRLYEEGRRSGRPNVEEILYCHELSGDLQVRQGQADLAARQYETALKLAPNHPRLTSKLEQLRRGDVPAASPSPGS